MSEGCTLLMALWNCSGEIPSNSLGKRKTVMDNYILPSFGFSSSTPVSQSLLWLSWILMLQYSCEPYSGPEQIPVPYKPWPPSCRQLQVILPNHFHQCGWLVLHRCCWSWLWKGCSLQSWQWSIKIRNESFSVSPFRTAIVCLCQNAVSENDHQPAVVIQSL